MSAGRTAVAVMAGVVGGGLILCGVGAWLVSGPHFKAGSGSNPTSNVAPVDRGPEHEVLPFQAKMVGLAQIKYSADHDDLLPPIQGFREAVSPYLKYGERHYLDKYVPTLGGVTQTSIPHIETTAIGYMPGETGAGVVYADGSSDWVAGAAHP